MGATLILAACGDEGENSVDEGEQNEEGTVEEEAGNDGEALDLPQLNNEVASEEQEVVMKTSMGDIHLKLFPEYAPKAVENFVTHAEDGYYEGVVFHRVIEDFMIQGGDPEGTGAGGESVYGEPFEDEFAPELMHFNGALSMANSGPNTNSSQFFIVHNSELDASLVEAIENGVEEGQLDEQAGEAYIERGGTPHLDGRHTVFGHVIEGMDVVNAIATTEVGPDPDNPHNPDRPEEDVVIEEIEVID